MTTTPKKEKTSNTESSAVKASQPDQAQTSPVTQTQPETVKPVAPIAQAPAKPNPKLIPNRLKSAEFTVLTFHAVTEAGVTLEQIQDKAFFTHCANQLKPGNEIKVESEDGSFWAWLLVRAVVGTDVITQLLLEKHFDPIDQGSIDVGDYQVKWGGTVDRWRVMRKTDNLKVSSGHANKLAALNWLTEHQKALAA